MGGHQLRHRLGIGHLAQDHPDKGHAGRQIQSGFGVCGQFLPAHRGHFWLDVWVGDFEGGIVLRGLFGVDCAFYEY